MLSNVDRTQAFEDTDALILWIASVKAAARTFAELSEQFRQAAILSKTPSVLKRDVHGILSDQAGKLLCDCWDRGMLLLYCHGTPEWDLRDFGSKFDHLFTWFAFIRWHLAPQHIERFRTDWKEHFVPELDLKLKTGREVLPESLFTSPVSDDSKELVLRRLHISAAVQTTACTIMAEELQEQVEGCERRLGELLDVERQTPDDQDTEDEPPDGQSAEHYVLATDAVMLFPDDFSDTNALKRYANRKGIPVRKPSAQRLEVDLMSLQQAILDDKKQSSEAGSDIFERYSKLRAEKDAKTGKK